MMNRWLLASALCVTLAGVASARTIDRVVAVVNDEIILDSELEEFTAPMLRNPVDLDTAEGAAVFESLKKKYLDKLIDQRLIGQQAEQLKLSVTPEEVDRAIEEIKKSNKIDDAEFLEALKAQGLSLPAYRKTMKKQILDMKVISTAVRSRIQITDDEVRTAYAQSDRQNAGERLAHLREIVITVPKGATAADVQKKQQLAAKIASQAVNGGDFAQLAKSYSESDTRTEGGDLGFVQAGNLVDTLATVVQGMDPGDIRGPIRTETGWEVLELVEWKAGNLRPYDEVKEQLRRQLYDAQVQKATESWVKELRRKAHIDVK